MSKRWRVALPATTIDVPAAACFDALRKGALFSIARVYWDCGCDDNALPDTDDGWQAIACASSMAWHRIREKVLIAFEQSKPNIQHAHKTAQKASQLGRRAAAYARHVQAAKLQAKKQKPELSDKSAINVPFQPLKSSTYDFGHHGHASNGQEIPHKTARGLIGASLTDKPTKT
jgi:hypothetical protein